MNMGTVYHLITKALSPDKYHMDPETFIANVETAFKALATLVKEKGLTEIAMSYMCTGMDCLHRLWAMETLYKAFVDVPVVIHFFKKFESRRWKDIGKLFEPHPAHTTPTQLEDIVPDRVGSPTMRVETPVPVVTTTPPAPNLTDPTPIPAETTPNKPTSAPVPAPRQGAHQKACPTGFL